MRQAAGPFMVSLFTTPEVLAVGPADVSAMVEMRDGRVLLDADVVVTLTPPSEGATPIIAHLTQADAANRLLQAAQVSLPKAGVWRAEVKVNEAGREAMAVTELTVADHSSRRGTVWLFIVLPACGIALFAWAQVEKRRARRRLLHSVTMRADRRP